MQDKNFVDQTNLILSDQCFLKCNFFQQQPRFVDNKWRGIKIFTEDTPRVFINCNLCNAEPPPGSLVQDCLTIIRRYNIVDGDQTFDIAYGFWNISTGEYEYFDSPRQYVKGADS